MKGEPDSLIFASQKVRASVCQADSARGKGPREIGPEATWGLIGLKAWVLCVSFI